MRIVVRSVLLLALIVGLPSVVLAQSRDYSDRPGTSSQQYGDGVVSTGTYSGRDVKWPDGWVQETDRDDRYPDPDGNAGATASQQQDQSDNQAAVEGDGGSAYQESSGDTAATAESDSGNDDRYGDAAGTAENGDSDTRYGDAAGTAESEGGDDYRNGDAAGTAESEGGDTAETVEGDGTSDDRYGSATGTFQDFGGNSYSRRYRSSPQGRYGSASRYGSGRVTNCYIDRRGRTICR